MRSRINLGKNRLGFWDEINWDEINLGKNRGCVYCTELNQFGEETLYMILGKVRIVSFICFQGKINIVTNYADRITCTPKAVFFSSNIFFFYQIFLNFFKIKQ
jgi:hypothetical protein